jgi:hypothetical protein
MDKLARLSGVPRGWVSTSFLRSDGHLYDNAGNKIGRLLKIIRDADDDVPLLTNEEMALVENIWNKVVSEAERKKLQLTNALRILVETKEGAFLTVSDLTDVSLRHGIRSPELVKECLDAIGYKEPYIPPRGGTNVPSSHLQVGTRYIAQVNNQLNKIKDDNGPFLRPHYETDPEEILQSLLDPSDNVEPLMKRISSAVACVPSSGAGLVRHTDGTLGDSEESNGEKKNDSVDDEEAASKNGWPAAAGGGKGGATLTRKEKKEKAKIEQIERIEGEITSILDGRNEHDLKERALKYGRLLGEHDRKGGMRAELDAAVKDGMKDDCNTYKRLFDRHKNLEQARLELAALRDPSIDIEAMKKRSEIIKQITSYQDAIEKLSEGTTENEMIANSSAFRKWDYAKSKAIAANEAPSAEPPLLRKHHNDLATLRDKRKKLANAQEKLKDLDESLATKPSTEQVAEPTAVDIVDEEAKEIEAEIEQIEGEITSILDGRNEDDLKERALKYGRLLSQHDRKGGKRAELDAAVKDGMKDDYNMYRLVMNRRRKLASLRQELAALRDPSIDKLADSLAMKPPASSTVTPASSGKRKANVDNSSSIEQVTEPPAKKPAASFTVTLSYLKKRSEITNEITKYEKEAEEILKGTTEYELMQGSNAFKKWEGAKRRAILDGTVPPAEPPLLRKQKNDLCKLRERRKKLADAQRRLKVFEDGLATKHAASFTVAPVSSGKRKADNDNSTSKNQAAEPPANIGDSKPVAKKKRAHRKKAATEDQVMQSAHPTPSLPALPLDHMMMFPLVGPSGSMETDDSPIDTTPAKTAFV